ncbi:MAG: hypothetical protein GY929_08205, partial [Actinomycetia bacterium]|nr:hypothetical protein [Actinomycetes bacterium]
GKRFRGTALDPFGRAKIRKAERRLITDYEQTISELVAKITAEPLDDETQAAAVELASLPDVVRGYEDIKLDNIEHYHSETARLRSNLGL